MAINSQGIQFFFSVSANSTAAADLVGQVQSIGGPSGSAATIDVTNLASSGKEYLIGLKDEGEVTLSVFTDTTDTVQAALWTARSNRTKGFCVIDFNDSTAAATDKKLSFQGYVMGYTFNTAVDDALKSDITIKITGAATYSSAI